MSGDEPIRPSWEAFGPCERCRAVAGEPCRPLNVSYRPGFDLPHQTRNPHAGRKQVGPRAARR